MVHESIMRSWVVEEGKEAAAVKQESEQCDRYLNEKMLTSVSVRISPSLTYQLTLFVWAIEHVHNRRRYLHGSHPNRHCGSDHFQSEIERSQSKIEVVGEWPRYNKSEVHNERTGYYLLRPNNNTKGQIGRLIEWEGGGCYYSGTYSMRSDQQQQFCMWNEKGQEGIHKTLLNFPFERQQ